MADVRESVAESTEMESIRIELELDKQTPITLGPGSVHRFSRVDNQRDSGLPDIDHQNSTELPELPNGHTITSNTMASNSYARGGGTTSAQKPVTSPTYGV